MLPPKIIRIKKNIHHYPRLCKKLCKIPSEACIHCPCTRTFSHERPSRAQGGGSKRSFETQGRRGIKWRGEEEERAMTKAMIKDNSRSKIKDYSRGPRGPSTNQSPRKYKMHEARIPRGHPSRDPPPLFLPSFLVIPHPL